MVNKMIYMISLGTITIGIIYAIINLILIPFLTSRLGSPAIAGLLLSSGTLLAGILGPVLGEMSDRLRNRINFIFGLVMISMVTIIGMAFSSGVFLMAFTILFVASGFSLLTPYSAFVGDYSPLHEKDKNFGFVMGSTNLFFFISSLLIGVFYKKGISFTFLTLSILMIIPILILAIYVRRNPPVFTEENSVPRGTISFLRENRILFIFFFIQFFAWFSIGGLLPYLTSFLKNEALIPLGISASIVGLFTLFTSFSSFLTGWTSKIVGQKRLYFISILSMFLIFSCIFLSYKSILTIFKNPLGSEAILFILSIPLGLFYSLSTSVLSSLVSPEDQGKAFGLSNFFLIISQSLSITVIGIVINKLGYNYMMLVISLGFLLASFGAFILMKRERSNN